MLLEVPFLFISYYNTNILYQSALSWVNDLESTYIIHLSLRAIFLVCFTFICSIYKPLSAPIKPLIKIRFSYLMSLFAIVVISYSAFLNQVGGLQLILQNMSEKTDIIRGSGITRLFFVYSSLLLASISACYYAQSNQSLIKKIFLFFILALVFLMLASYGERKNAVVFILIFLFCWHIWVKELTIFSYKFILGALMLIGFSALAPPLRESGAAIKYALEPTMLLYDAIPHLGELFRRFSDIDISIFILNYFNEPTQYFYFSTLPNFFYGVIPSFLYPGKPPLDEAVFIYNLANGVDPGVDAPFSDFIPVGWPVSRYTSGLVHLGIFGVFIFSIITSYLLIMLNNFSFKNNSPFIYPLYLTVVITGAGISNAYIFNFIISTVVIFLLFIAFRALNSFPRIKLR
jgi:hypothetical protein